MEIEVVKASYFELDFPECPSHCSHSHSGCGFFFSLWPRLNVGAVLGGPPITMLAYASCSAILTVTI